MKVVISLVTTLLIGCSHQHVFYQQGATLPPPTTPWNDHTTTWTINGATVGRFNPAGVVPSPPSGWFCQYGPTTNTTSGYTLRWVQCDGHRTRIHYALACALREDDHREFQIGLRPGEFILASCDSHL